MSIEIENKFGFTVKKKYDDPTLWAVYLPHQCDEWGITGEEYDELYKPHSEAVVLLKQFISEANQALAMLKIV